MGKLLDNGRGEAEAHVVLSLERHQNNVEITVPYHHHELIGHGSDPDLFRRDPRGGWQARSTGYPGARKMAGRQAVPRKEAESVGDKPGQAQACEETIKPARAKPAGKARAAAELVIITGMSGSGKASVLRALEDLGYYAVDNLPVDLIPTFAELVRDSATIRHAALVVDVREGVGLRKLPAIYRKIKKSVNARLVFLEADDDFAAAPLQRDAASASFERQA